MGKIGGAMSGLKNLGADDVTSLSPTQKIARAGLGAAAGGLNQYAKQSQQVPQGGMSAPIQIGQPQYADFSQIAQLGKRNNFYGA